MYFRIFKMPKSDTKSVFQIPKFWIHLYILSISIPKFWIHLYILSI